MSDHPRRCRSGVPPPPDKPPLYNRSVILILAVVLSLACIPPGRAANSAADWDRQGQAAEARQNTAQAIGCFRRAVHLAPHELLYTLDLSAACRNSGRYAEAEGRLTQALRRFPLAADQKSIRENHAVLNVAWAQGLLRSGAVTVR